MRILVTSVKDIASQTIKKVLIEDHGFSESGESFEGNPIYTLGNSVKLITTTREMIESNHLEQHFNAEVFVFCSRHKAQSGKPALLVHSTGNLGEEALFGGKPQELSVSTGSLVSVALRALLHERDSRNLEEFDVTMEVTHHGPTSLGTPLLFVELGSDEIFWRHKEGARSVAAAAMACIKEPFNEDSMIGFGGNHYASKFNRLVIEKNLRIGHIAPKHALDGLTEDVVLQMIQRSRETTKSAVIDWKGTNSQQKAHILPILEKLGLEVVRARNL